MTIGDLLDELAKYPRHMPVHVVMESVWLNDELGSHQIFIEKSEAQPLDRVTFEGNHVLLESE